MARPTRARGDPSVVAVSLAVVAMLISACTKPKFFNPIPITNPTAEAMTVTAIAPEDGTTGGGTPITIFGSDFEAGATVTIGGVACQSVIVVSDQRMTCITPGHVAGNASVVVSDPDGRRATLAGAYEYLANTLSAQSRPGQLTIGPGVRALVSVGGGSSLIQTSTDVSAAVSVVYQP